MSPISNGQDQHIISGLDIGSDIITCVIGQTNDKRTNIKAVRDSQNLPRFPDRGHSGRGHPGR